MTNRSEQKEQRQQLIMETALDLFVMKGYAATTIRDIAKQAGISTGLLFHYYASKEALYNSLIELGIFGPQFVLGQMDRTRPFESLKRAVGWIFAALEAEPYVAKLFMLMSQALYRMDMPASSKQLASQMDYIGSYYGLIQAGQKEGTIREGDPGALSLAFWSAIQGIAEARVLFPDIPCPSGDWVLDIIRK